MAVMTITNENFKQEVLQSDVPVLVDFWATWCGPCKMFSPIIDAFAEENEGRVKVGKVNVDEQQALAQEFGILSIPTVVCFKNGKPTQTAVGVQQKENLKAMIG